MDEEALRKFELAVKHLTQLDFKDRRYMHVELVIGTDHIVRLNLDGSCALRFRIVPDAVTVVRDDRQHADAPVDIVNDR